MSDLVGTNTHESHGARIKIRLLRRRIFIHHLYVATKYQGQGVGSMLLNGAKMKYGNLSLKCMVQNQKALNFYLSQGFEIVSQVDDELGGYYYMSFVAQT